MNDARWPLCFHKLSTNITNPPLDYLREGLSNKAQLFEVLGQ